MSRYDSLRTVIAEKREEILRAWSASVRPQLDTQALTSGDLRDHLPAFLDDLAVALTPGSMFNGTLKPAQHGRQRLLVGFDVAAVVRDYGMLGEAILSVADSVGYWPTYHEHRILLSELSEAAQSAVTAYTTRRDAELDAATTKHIAFVAHQLRNPLSSARISLSLLSNSTSATQLGTKQLNALQRSIAVACDLVDNVLVAERLDRHVEVRAEVLRLADIFEEVRADIAPHAEVRNVTVSCEGDNSSIFFADRRLLLSALENLAHNAVKFTKPGTRVVLRAHRLESKMIFEIEDQCGGLPLGRAGELFQPFVQRSADRSGFGLGLAIAKQAVEAHGGSIVALDRPGSGCVFVIELPIGVAGPANDGH
jgi:signal transduction histidine kinase